MTKYKIIYDREKCIRAGNCAAVANKFWEIAEDSKADLIGGTYNKETKKFELIIEEKDLAVNKTAVEVCPDAEIIKIVKLEE